jgi:curli biogenesis system outer membrane secretion channel CsgG
MLKIIHKSLLVLFFFAGSAAFAQVSADFSGGGAVAIGTSTTACDGTTEGAIKYDDSENCISLCNGNAWDCIPPTELTMYVTAAKVQPKQQACRPE